MILEYNEEQFKNGEANYDILKNKLTSLTIKVKHYEKQAQSINTCTPKFNYDGTFKDIFDKLTTSLENLNSKLEVSKTIIERGKGIIESYNNDKIDYTSALFLLDNLKNTYFNSFSKDFNSDSLPTDNINYANIYDEGYIPQGITVIGDTVIISAYFKAKGLFNKEEKSSKLFMYNLKDPSKNFSVLLDTKSHVGGVTFDSKNHVLLVTAGKGKIKAYNYDAILGKVEIIKKNDGGKKEPVIDVNDSVISSTIKLKSNLTINYNKISDDKTETGYNAASVFYDNKTDEIYINRFSKNDGKLITSKVEFDPVKCKYDMVDEKTLDIDSGVQAISTYHKDGQKYLIESRSYGNNQSQITVRNITDGKNKLVGTQILKEKYSEGIQVDNSGKAIITFESGIYGKNNTTTTIDINKIIAENNQDSGNIRIITNKYETGSPRSEGYEL